MKPAGRLLLALALALSSCVTSVNPIAPAKNAKIDERLVGKWRNTKDHNDTIEVAKIKGVRLRVKDTELFPKDEGCECYVTKLGPDSFLNIQGVDSKTGVVPPNAPYVLAKYDISQDGNMLALLLPDFRALSPDVKAGHLKGTVQQETGVASSTQDILITDSSKNIAAYITTKGTAAIFTDKWGTYEKMK